MIVNETFVKTFWPGVTDPVGRRIRFNGERAPWMTVVGLVEDVRHYGLERPMRPGVYMPVAQLPANSSPSPSRRTGTRGLHTDRPRRHSRTRSGTAAVPGANDGGGLRAIAVAAHALLVAARRLRLTALVMALGGTYGVTSYLVSQRTREIGIRVALGARTLDIARGVLRASLTIVAIGILVGLAASVRAARQLSTLLFGVPPHDTGVLISALLVLLVTAAAADVLPRGGPGNVDPMKSLRVE